MNNRPSENNPWELTLGPCNIHDYKADIEEINKPLIFLAIVEMTHLAIGEKKKTTSEKQQKSPPSKWTPNRGEVNQVTAKWTNGLQVLSGYHVDAE